jgi:hypothetical protein
MFRNHCMYCSGLSRKLWSTVALSLISTQHGVISTCPLLEHVRCSTGPTPTGLTLHLWKESRFAHGSEEVQTISPDV